MNTGAPKLALEQVAARSNNRAPSFTGTAVNFEKEEVKPVTVHVFDSESHEVASAEAAPVNGKWTAKLAANALSSGKNTYTARATQPSGLSGNGTGRQQHDLVRRGHRSAVGHDHASAGLVQQSSRPPSAARRAKPGR